MIGLGLFSIGLGLTEIFAAKQVARVLGLENRVGMIRFFGLREIAVGVGILASSHARPWLFARVAGDVLDLALLGSALSPRNSQRSKAALATASVAGITVLDALSGARHRKENHAFG